MVVPIIAGAARAGMAAKGASRVNANSTKVVRRGNPANLNHAPKPRLVVDNTRTHPTTDEKFSRDQEGRTTSERILRAREGDRERETKVEERRRGKRVARFGKERAIMRSIKLGHGKTKGLATVRRKQKAALASVIAGNVCIPLYFYQVIFWIFAVVGLGLESGMSAGELLDLSVAEKILLWAASSVLPGQTFFMVGWVISSTIGVLMFGVTYAIYTIKRVDPFRGNSLVAFIVALSLTIMPLGLFPWVYLWIYFVYKSQARSN